MNRLVKGILTLALLASPLAVRAEEPKQAAKPAVTVGAQAPEFKIKDPAGKVINLADLTAQGPVLVRLTCGCSGCDKELAYFREVSDAYKGQGLVSLYVFKEPDAKVAQYVQDKKLNLLYAVDTKGESWNVFQTKTMPTNFLIEKGGKISAIAAGCEVHGLIAQKVSEKAAKLVGANPVNLKVKPVDVKGKVEAKQAEKK